MSTFRLQTAPTFEPVTLAEAKRHLRRGDVTEDDARISRLIPAARLHVETKTERAICTQTWKYLADAFWTGVLYIPRPPLASVTSITYLDTSGDSQTASSSLYTVDTDSRPGRIYLAKDQTWPTTYDVRHAVTVTYTCGEAQASIPENVKLAVLLLVEHWYEADESAELPPSLRSLIWGLKIPWAA